MSLTIFPTSRPHRSSSFSSTSSPPTYTTVDRSHGPPPPYTPPGTSVRIRYSANELPPRYEPLPYPSRRWVYSRTVVSLLPLYPVPRALEDFEGNVLREGGQEVRGDGLGREGGGGFSGGGIGAARGDVEGGGAGRRACGSKVGPWLWLGFLGMMAGCVVLAVALVLWVKGGEE
ncbi:hypothetical protein LTR29_000589 [Friedmanniomyces endolithicus]|uniref:Uncharacterized protein n=1 Tax=Friedmanniomyces endolithicus TaxID=329885 RepID=A0A4U0UA46_9PEZI|nr:hypothetical protein LTS09_006024 [Friedmanniomyces endolithicus]KAK0316548.1 hypothetical protein LTR01_000297 [Friedmanniomyces endolithicus]KAK0834724.1 hypothetical protein LTR73_001014 [Friedmanniomyces endolithicus]KAK0948065.1 hypothetical protein LTR29_000589 [Friedmanniomyces endolithicus]TKA32231.1 hypothetical protein B0A54_14995 [Friedmanniomyces endolithicus]